MGRLRRRLPAHPCLVRPQSPFCRLATEPCFIIRQEYGSPRPFGPTITLSTGRIIPTRWVGEQHVREDLGFIPSFNRLGQGDPTRTLDGPPGEDRGTCRSAPRRRRSGRCADMSRAHLNLGVSPRITPLAMLRIAIRRLHPDTLAVRSWRQARKRTGQRALAGPCRSAGLGACRLRVIRLLQLTIRLPTARPSGRAFSFWRHYGRLFHPVSASLTWVPEKATAALGLLARLHLDEDGAGRSEYAGFG